MNPKTFFEFKTFFNHHQGKDLMVVRLESTEGATYRKAGALKLVHKEGSSRGLISGGCLEAEIIEKAFVEKEFTMDTTPAEDRLFGYGLGCQGRLHLSSQPIHENWLTFCEKQLNFLESQIPVLHIVGGGLDAQDLMELTLTLKWPFKAYDYRRDIINQLSEKDIPAIKVLNNEIPDFDKSVRNIFVIMSHSYEFDMTFLKKACESECSFIGLLGPEKRKEQMISDLETILNYKVSADQKASIHGPVGVGEMGRGPQAIALSIVAELQKKIYGQFY